VKLELVVRGAFFGPHRPRGRFWERMVCRPPPISHGRALMLPRVLKKRRERAHKSLLIAASCVAIERRILATRWTLICTSLQMCLQMLSFCVYDPGAFAGFPEISEFRNSSGGGGSPVCRHIPRVRQLQALDDRRNLFAPDELGAPLQLVERHFVGDTSAQKNSGPSPSSVMACRSIVRPHHSQGRGSISSGEGSSSSWAATLIRWPRRHR
jgi:hypothetical protein